MLLFDFIRSLPNLTSMSVNSSYLRLSGHRVLQSEVLALALQLIFFHKGRRFPKDDCSMGRFRTYLVVDDL